MTSSDSSDSDPPRKQNANKEEQRRTQKRLREELAELERDIAELKKRLRDRRFEGGAVVGSRTSSRPSSSSSSSSARTKGESWSSTRQDKMERWQPGGNDGGGGDSDEGERFKTKKVVVLKRRVTRPSETADKGRSKDRDLVRDKDAKRFGGSGGGFKRVQVRTVVRRVVVKKVTSGS